MFWTHVIIAQPSLKPLTISGLLILLVVLLFNPFVAVSYAQGGGCFGLSQSPCSETCPPEVTNLSVSVLSIYNMYGQIKADFSVSVGGKGHINGYGYQLLLTSQVGSYAARTRAAQTYYFPAGTCRSSDTTVQFSETLDSSGSVTFVAHAIQRYYGFVYCQCSTYTTINVALPPQPAEKGRMACESRMGDPIDARTGNVYHARTDVTIDSWLDFPLRFTRSYNSHGDTGSVLGPKWRHSYEYSLSDIGDSVLAFNEGDGRILQFRGQSLPLGFGQNYDISYDSVGDRYSITEYDSSRRYVFDSSGRLDTLADRNYGRLTFSYDDDLLDTIADVSGRFLTLHYDENNRLQYLKLPDSTVLVTYEYDTTSGYPLRKVTYADSTWEEYAYESVWWGLEDRQEDHMLATVTNSDSTVVNYEYDYHARGCETNLNDTMNVTTIQYSVRVGSFDGQQTIIYDTYEEGPRTTTYHSILSEDSSHRVHTSIENPCCVSGSVTYKYDSSFNRNVISYPNGRKDSMLYDNAGRIEQYISDAGEEFQRRHDFIYEDSYKLLSRYSSASLPDTQYQHVIDYDRDSLGNLTSIRERGYMTPSLQFYDTSWLRHNSAGQLTKIDGPRTDVDDTTSLIYYGNGDLRYAILANGDTTTFGQLNNLGRMTWVRSPNGDTTRYVFDQHGHIVEYTVHAGTPDSLVATLDRNFNGNITKIVNFEGDTTDYIYDNNNLLTNVVDPLGNSIRLQYNNDSRVIGTVVIDSAGDTTREESYTYTSDGKLARIVNPDSTYIEYVYDNMGNVDIAYDANGNYTLYDYDQRNNPDTIKQLKDGEWCKTILHYDNNSNLTRVVDPDSNEFVFAYSDRNQVVYDSTGITGVTTYGYDKAGNLHWSKNAVGDSVHYTYDVLNRLTGVYTPDSNNVSYEYDGTEFDYGRGWLYKAINPNCTTRYEYDAFGRLYQEYRTDVGDTTEYVTTYAYDIAGNLTSVVYPSGHTYEYSYNAGDRVDRIRFQPAGDTSWIVIVDSANYQAMGPPESWVLGNDIKMSAHYNNRQFLDSLISDTLEVLGLAYSFDSVGNITNIRNLLDSTKDRSFTYDRLNQLESAASSDFPESTFVYFYGRTGNRDSVLINVDTLQRIVSYTYTDNKLTGVSDTTITTFPYDSLGSVTLLVVGTDTLTFEYNDMGQLISIDSGNTAAYAYDVQHRRIRTSAGGDTQRYFYSPSGLMASEFNDSTGWNADYIYLHGRPIATVRPDGDSAIVFWYHTDHMGTPMAMTNKDQTVVWRGDYYPYGELYSEMVSANNDIRFPGQWHDRESGLYYNWHRYYDPTTGRYLQADPIGLAGGMNLYAYVGNNPIVGYDFYGLEDSSTPWAVGWEWLTGEGARERHFVDGDPFTESLRQHKHIRELVKRVSEGSLPETGDYGYDLSGWRGVPKYTGDYLNLVTFGQTGNLAATYLGSYNLSYSLSEFNPETGSAILLIHVRNASTISSATHPPLIGYTDWWNTNIGTPLDDLFSTGPMSRTVQIFDFSEPITRKDNCR